MTDHIKESHAYKMGRSSVIDGTNNKNCHPVIFSTSEQAADWERGVEDALREKTMEIKKRSITEFGEGDFVVLKDTLRGKIVQVVPQMKCIQVKITSTKSLSKTLAFGIGDVVEHRPKKADTFTTLDILKAAE